MTIGVGSLLFDASQGWPDLVQAKADGYAGIIGYVSDNPAKNLTVARVKQARTLGMSINLVWEDGARDFATWTLAECATAGKRAAQQKAALGIPASVPVFAAVDYDVPAAVYPVISANIAEFAHNAGGPAAGYCEAAMIDYLFARRVAAYGWEPAAMSWSAGKVSPNACLLQRASVTRPRIAGDYDEDVVLKADFGAWMPPEPLAPFVMSARVMAASAKANGACAHGSVLAAAKLIQAGLNAEHASTPTLVVDGFLGPRSRAAYAIWQQRNRLPATGLPELRSLAALGAKHGFRAVA